MISSLVPLGLALLSLSADTEKHANPTAANHPATTKEILQIQADRVLLDDGSIVEKGVVIVLDGKIRSVESSDKLDSNLPSMKLEGTLTAGMVAMNSQSGTRGDTWDSARTVMGDGQIVHSFNPEHSDFAAALEAGVTSMVLAPSGQNLIGGLTAVVKSDGGGVLSPAAHLALSFGSGSLVQGRGGNVFFFDVQQAGSMAADGGPENTTPSGRGGRAPTSYSGALRALRGLFAAAEGNVGRAAGGQLPVLIEAWDRHEVQRAVDFARQQGLKGCLRGAPLAGDEDILPAIVESGLAVILGPFADGQTQPSLESVAKLQAAGVAVAFALDAPAQSPERLRYTAAMAVQAGADAGAVWRALTSDAARLAGVGERVGSLAAGHDADLVLWSGDPLQLTSQVRAVFVDGRLAFDGNQE